MNRQDKVRTSLICIGEAATQSGYALLYRYLSRFAHIFYSRLSKRLRGAYLVEDTNSIPNVLRSILGTIAK